jgi:hypothetical protein
MTLKILGEYLSSEDILGRLFLDGCQRKPFDESKVYQVISTAQIQFGIIDIKYVSQGIVRGISPLVHLDDPCIPICELSPETINFLGRQ